MRRWLNRMDLAFLGYGNLPNPVLVTFRRIYNMGGKSSTQRERFLFNVCPWM